MNEWQNMMKKLTYTIHSLSFMSFMFYTIQSIQKQLDIWTNATDVRRFIFNSKRHAVGHCEINASYIIENTIPYQQFATYQTHATSMHGIFLLL